MVDGSNAAAIIKNNMKMKAYEDAFAEADYRNKMRFIYILF